MNVPPVGDDLAPNNGTMVVNRRLTGDNFKGLFEPLGLASEAEGGRCGGEDLDGGEGGDNFILSFTELSFVYE